MRRVMANAMKSREQRAGILNFMERNDGQVDKLFGIVKQRYSDFIVHEIDMRGNVVHLSEIIKFDEGSVKDPLSNVNNIKSDEKLVNLSSSDIEATKSAIAASAAAVNTASSDATATAPAKDSPADKLLAKISMFLDEENGLKLKQFIDESIESDTQEGSFTLKIKVQDKTSRTTIHQSVREHLGDRMVTRTLNDDDKSIQVIIGSENTISRMPGKDGKFYSVNIQQKGKRRRDNDRDGDNKQGDSNGKQSFESDNKKLCGFTASTQGNRQQGNSHHEKFLQFTLYKEGMDLNAAISSIARKLRMRTRAFSYAGTKDKRAITSQLVTAFSLSPWKLASIQQHILTSAPQSSILQSTTSNDGENGDQVKLTTSQSGYGFYILGDAKYVKQGLRLGDLCGNRFTICLRNVSVNGLLPNLNDNDENGAKSIGERILKSFSEKGFINYFGLQRFGTGEVMTHEIGKLLIKRQWKEAIDILLKSVMDSTTSGEGSVIESAYKQYLATESSDAKENEEAINKFLSVLDGRHIAARSILQAMVDFGCKRTDYLGCLTRIPRNLRNMYMHGYQSYLFNRVASERITKYGIDKPIVGDLVFVPKNSSYTAQNAIDTSIANVKYRANVRTHQAKVLTEEDIASGKYKMEDVILPLPGYDVIFPTHECGKSLYEQIMQDDGITLSMFENKQQFDFSLRGEYRHMIGHPFDVKWTWCEYSSPLDKLALSDYDKIQFGSTKQLSSTATTTTTIINESSSSVAEMETEQKKYIGLVVEFSLLQSTYATMCLRELLRLSTDGTELALLNELESGEVPLPTSPSESSTNNNNTSSCSSATANQEEDDNQEYEENNNNNNGN